MLQKLLHSRFQNVSANTVDYWMKENRGDLTSSDVFTALANAPWNNNKSTLQLYLHVPYCAQNCSFCAFSGGNNIFDFKNTEHYADLLVWQMREYLRMSQAANKNIISVHIGGGSPDLLRKSIRKVLQAIRDLPGCNNKTEISVEFALSTVSDEFINALIDFNVTKASFGVQIMDTMVRKYLNMPINLVNMDETCNKLSCGVPIINVDLITGFPGQTMDMVLHDLLYFINHPRINSISTYLLTPGAAPKLIADMKSGVIPTAPNQTDQALFRLHSYATLLRHGWVRKGTNTYMNPNNIVADILDIITGNECIGARRYEDFLLGCGPQAISSIPGARIENTVNIKKWIAAAEKDEHSLALQKCSLEHQRDMALWIFPLMANGLTKSEFNELKMSNVLDKQQINNFTDFIREGLIMEESDRYILSIIGEVFMGHLVFELKLPKDQQVIAKYIDEGYTLGTLMSENKIPKTNIANDRQHFDNLVTSVNGIPQ